MAIALVLAVSGGGGLGAAEHSEGGGFFFNGLLDLATTTDDAAAERFNTLIRGDSPFDNLRLRLFADWVVQDRLTLFSQILLDPSSDAELKDYLRVYLRWEILRREGAELFVQAGKIPAAFGSFPDRAYSDRNPLVGIPLMYHYFSSLRSDQLPANNLDLLDHRGQGAPGGFGGFYGGGAAIPRHGLPMIYEECWDTGIEMLGSAGRLEYHLALTQGTLSTPQFSTGDDNGGKQIVGHLAWIPGPGVVLGASYARGPFLSRDVESAVRALGRDLEDFDQEIWGINVEYGVRHLQLVGEIAGNVWQVPTITDLRGRRQDLESTGWYLQGRYDFLPGAYFAARLGRIDFGAIDDGTGSGHRTSWDADVERFEAGFGYSFTDRLIGKLVWQQDRRAAPVRARDRFLAAQVSLGF